MFRMKKNIGKKDRLIRFGISMILFLAAAWERSWILLAAALFVLFEAVASWCVLYQWLGKTNCPIDPKNKS